MRGQHGRSDSVVGRAALVLLTLAAALGLCTALLVPVAAASPLGEADDAITAAWKAAGGDNSDLGPKQGECYAAGDGFAQDFVHGKMFFTPATGPRSMTGAVLDKYEALGGPAASDLGFPTINEVPGLAGPDSRVNMFSASDKPVIFWTSAHGAFVVRGAINAAWDKLGSSGGALGVPVGDETYDGEVATQAFSGGRVSWNRLTKAFTTDPPDLAKQLTDLQVPVDPTADINMAWRAAGGASGPLGPKVGGQYPVGSDGLAQNFTGGKVFFSPATGANAVESDILSKYESLGGPGGNLGFPIANEADGGLKPASRVSPFSAADNPVIFWTPKHGAYVVRGAIKAGWDKLGGATGKLGAPQSDPTLSNGVVTQRFTGGQIAWNQAKNTFSTQPANLASGLSGVHVPGQQTPANAAPTAGGGVLTRHRWWWWAAAIPALLLLGMAVPAARVWRRRHRAVRGDTPDTRAVEPDYANDGGDDAESVSQWSADADSAPATSSLSEVYRAPVRPRTVRLPSQQPASDWTPQGHDDLAEESLVDEIVSAAELSDKGEGFDQSLDQGPDEDPDAVDTAPTRIPSPGELQGEARGGRHAAAENGDDTDHFATTPIAAGQLAIHLPMDDPYQVPDGYPVKANASFGLYYMPDSALYEDTMAEIWFASEEIARANGFTKAG
ncbi:MAG: LGFP repeat-containing protein [Mycobacterium sp.]|nr:LGFP repeat-containing protein [Mycobacterium sp.]